jgi:hypothetical protein
MRYTICSVAFFLAFLQFGCAIDKPENDGDIAKSKSKKETIKVIHLPKSGLDTLKATYFADTIIYVPLETNENSYIRRIAKLKKNDSLIVISDMRKILVFGLDGSFIRQIGRRGKGPGEYGTIGNFDLYHDTIYVAHRQSISKYTLDGQFVREYKLSKAPSYFSVYSNGLIALYYEYTGEVYYYNQELEITDTLTVEDNVSPDRSKWQRYDQGDLFFETCKDRLLFNNYKSDTIWDISTKRKIIAHIIEADGKLLPWNKQVEYFKGDFEKYEKVVEPYRKFSVNELPGYLLIYERDWSKGFLHSVYIHNVAGNTTKAFKAHIHEDILGNIKLPLWRYSISTEDEFITGAYPSDLLKTVREMAFNESIYTVSQKTWIKEISKVKEGDNPVLLIMKPRKASDSTAR